MEQATMQTKKISVKVPIHIDDLEMNQAYYQELIAATLQHNGALSLKEARQLIGKSRREFEEDILPKFGYTTMDNFMDNTEIEIQHSRRP